MGSLWSLLFIFTLRLLYYMYAFMYVFMTFRFFPSALCCFIMSTECVRFIFSFVQSFLFDHLLMDQYWNSVACGACYRKASKVLGCCFLFFCIFLLNLLLFPSLAVTGEEMTNKEQARHYLSYSLGCTPLMCYCCLQL